MFEEDKNSLGFWFPKIESAGLHVPQTQIVKTDVPLVSVLDREAPQGLMEFIGDLEKAANEIGFPCFLRTGHGSGKHDWRDTCYLVHEEDIASHVVRLVEWSYTVDLMGLPVDTWAVREMLKTKPLFSCQSYGGFPVTREFRIFVLDNEVTHIQPYWPEDAVERGSPDIDNWRELLDRSQALSSAERDSLVDEALKAVAAVGGGYWSIDFLQDSADNWWLTDIADGARSYFYQPPPFISG